METELKRHILFIMHDGMEYYPEKKPAGEDIRQVIKVLPSFSDEQFYYLQTRQLLVLKVSLPQGVGCLYLLIRKVEEPEIPVIMKSVEPARLALTCFLRNEITVQQRVEQKTNDILLQAFESRQFCMEDFLADFDIRLDPSQGYYVMLVDFCRSIPDSTVVDFKASLMQFECKHREVTAYPLFWRGKGVVILQDLREQEGWASAEVDASLRASSSVGRSLFPSDMGFFFPSVSGTVIRCENSRQRIEKQRLRWLMEKPRASGGSADVFKMSACCVLCLPVA